MATGLESSGCALVLVADMARPIRMVGESFGGWRFGRKVERYGSHGRSLPTDEAPTNGVLAIFAQDRKTGVVARQGVDGHFDPRWGLAEFIPLFEESCRVQARRALVS